MQLEQYVTPGTLWAFQRNGKTFASCYILKSNIEEDNGCLLWEATILIGDQIGRIYQRYEPWTEGHFVFVKAKGWPNGEGEWVCPQEVDESYMVPFDLLDKNPYPQVYLDFFERELQKQSA